MHFVLPMINPVQLMAIQHPPTWQIVQSCLYLAVRPTSSLAFNLLGLRDTQTNTAVSDGEKGPCPLWGPIGVIMSTHGWARHRHNCWAAELSRVLRRSDLTLSMFQFKIQYSNRVTVSRFNNSTSNFDFKILEASGICKVWPNSINIAL